MNDYGKHEPAREPNDLGRFFIERASAGDAEGLAALYEPDAVLVLPDGRTAMGCDAIRAFYAQLLSTRRDFGGGEQRPALRNGNLALTSTRTATGRVTAEVARQQADGSWLWVIDQPAIAG